MTIDLVMKGREAVRRLYGLALTATVALAARPALAQVTGGAAGAAISLICLFKGSHAVAEGRHLLPFVGGALGGIILAFGGPYILQRMGVG